MVLVCLVSTPSFAESRPDAGSSLRDLENARPLQLPEAAPDLGLPQAVPAPPVDSGSKTDQPTVTIRAFRLTGNTLFTTDQLLAVLTPWQGKALTLPQLQQLAARLDAFYMQQGYLLSRAYLPPQDLEDGILHMAIQEAKYDQIVLQNHSRTYAFILKNALSRLQADQAIHSQELESTLLLLNDLPGVKASSTLRAGQRPATTELLVEVTDSPMLAASLELDNFGSKVTGEYRLTAGMTLSNPLKIGDSLQLRLMSTDAKQRYESAMYELPLNRWFTKLGASYANLSYRLTGEWESLGAYGISRVKSLWLNQPLWRSRAWRLSGQWQYDDKVLKDNYDEIFASNRARTIRTHTASLQFNQQDSWGGGGLSSAALAYTNGTMHLDSVSEWFDRWGPRSHGRFSKVSASAQRLQRLTKRANLYLRASAQWASGNLDSAEKFSLGGVNGVRAYSGGEASGDEGWLANLEWRYTLFPGWQFSTFVDHGYTLTNKRLWTINGRPATSLNYQRRSAFGAGLYWFGDSYQLSLQSAWRMATHHPTQADQRHPQVWLQWIQRF